jgi:hypothetical protein
MKFRIFASLAIFVFASNAVHSQHTPSSEQQIETIKSEQKVLVEKILPDVDLFIKDIRNLPASRDRITIKFRLAAALGTNNKLRAQELFLEMISEFKQEANRVAGTDDEDGKILRLNEMKLNIQSSLQDFDPVLAKQFIDVCNQYPGLKTLESKIETEQNLSKAIESAAGVTPEIESEFRRKEFAKFDKNLAAGRITNEMLSMAVSGGYDDRDKMIDRTVKFSEKFINTNSQVNSQNISQLMNLIYGIRTLENEESEALTSSNADSNKPDKKIPSNLANRILSQVINRWIVPSFEKKEGIEFDAAKQFTQQIFFHNPQFEEIFSSQQITLLGNLIIKHSPELEPEVKLKELTKSASAQEIFTASFSLTDRYKLEYLNASVEKAIAEENFELLTEINKKSGIGITRNSNYSVLSALQNQIKLDQIPKAIRLLGQIKNKSERLEGIVQLADALLVKKKNQEAIAFLEEGILLAKSLPQNATRSKTLISIANSFLEIDPTKSLQLIESLMDQMNEVSQANAVLSKYRKSDENELDEMPLLQAHSEDFSELSEVLTRLARRRFTETNKLVERFQREDVRTDIRLSIITGILTLYTGGCGCSIW